MLGLFENKDLSEKLRAARANVVRLEAEEAASRVSPMQQEIAKERARIADLESQARRTDAETQEQYRVDLTARYNAARTNLAESLLSTAEANSMLEEVEQEAFERFPHGSRPGAPECFYQHSVSMPYLSFARRGRVFQWLVDLPAHLLPDAVREAMAVVGKPAEKPRPEIVEDRKALLKNMRERFARLRPESPEGCISIDMRNVQDKKQFFAELAKHDIATLCHSCLATNGQIVKGKRVKREGLIAPTVLVRCDTHANQ